MGKDIVELLEDYVTDDPLKWGRLSSAISTRRLELLVLREILVELRKINEKLSRQDGHP